MKAWLAAVVILSGALSASCSSAGPTKFTKTWEDPAYRGGPFRRLAIFLVAKNPNVRHQAEDEAVRRLPAGTQGTAGYRLIPPAAERDPEAVAAKLRAEGYDGAIVSRFVGVAEERTWNPARTYQVASPSGSFPVFYGVSWDTVTIPGHYTEQKVARVETNLWALSPDRLVWAGLSDTVDPESPQHVIEGVVDALFEHLQAAGLLAAR